ncbi:hypothetical protein [Curtobacterium flaccumfaciens]|uniref:hypothetical protein n=1 Tax=Curtobacterium flaccumfaciens TaxID=2035 RepID=UPI0027D2AD36|nr:hypothetical protein [Curtobacterium flaccumfaciens]
MALGAGPRGSIALIRAARARRQCCAAATSSPPTTSATSLPALRHRIALAPELQIEGQNADDALGALLAKVEAPRK